MDTEKASAKLYELRQVAEQMRSMEDATWAVPFGWLDHPAWRAARARCDQLIGGCVRIAEQVDSKLAEELQASISHASLIISAFHRIEGRLATDSEIDDILGPAGPRLVAKDLHPWVWNAAVDLW